MLPELSTVLYYVTQSEAVNSLKTADFVRHFDILTVQSSDPKTLFTRSLLVLYGQRILKKLGVYYLKSSFLDLRKSPLGPIFSRNWVFEDLKIDF